MTVETLDRYEAQEEGLDAAALELRMLDEVEATGRFQGRVETLDEIEDVLVDVLDEIDLTVKGGLESIEDQIDVALATFGTWVSDLHIRMGELEAKVLRGVKSEPVVEVDDEPDFDLGELLALDSEFDQVDVVKGHVTLAANELAKALFELGEVTGPARKERDEGEENVEYAYWALMKAVADLSSWQYEVEGERQAILEVN